MTGDFYECYYPIFDSDTIYNPAIGYNYLFIAKYDINGNVLWARSIGNKLWDPRAGGETVAADKYGNAYVGGWFADTAIFNTDTVYSASDGNTFLAKIGYAQNDVENVHSVKNNWEWEVYPNPNSGQFTIQKLGISGQGLGGSNTSIDIYNIYGQIINSLNPQVETLRQGAIQINLSSQPDGVYFYRVLSTNGTNLGNGKVVLVR